MRRNILFLAITVLFLFILTGCETTSPIAEYDSVTCLFTGTASETIIDYGPIIMEFSSTQVTLMTEDGNNVYTNQQELDDYIDAKFDGDHYDFIENRVTTFEESGYTCTYE